MNTRCVPLFLLLFLAPATSARAQVLIGEAVAWPSHEAFGSALVALGDMDGDGRGDVAVGAPLADEPQHGTIDEGVVHFYSGKPYSQPFLWPHLSSFGGFSHFGNDRHSGASLASTDLDLDGVPDAVVGAPGGPSTEGWVHVFQTEILLGAPPVIWSWSPFEVGIEFAFALCAIGDVNGDGYPDLAAGAPAANFAGAAAGRVYVLSGKLLLDGIHPPLLYVVDGPQADSRFGQALAATGDVNLDGVPDFAVGAPQYAFGRGRASVHSGADGSLIHATPGSNGKQLGWSIAAAGDQDLDGWPDVIAGMPGHDEGALVDAGGALVLSGRFMHLGLGPSTLISHLGQAAGERAGYAVTSVGQIDFDGKPELAVGAPTPSGTGKVRVLAGGSGTLLFEHSGAPLAWYGAALASAGDTNDDGRPELLVGAPKSSDGGRVEVIAACPMPDVFYCTAKVTSIGCQPRILTDGSSSSSASAPHWIRAVDVISQKVGLLFYGFEQVDLPLLGGTVCAGIPFVRTPGQSSGGNPLGNDCSGAYALDFNAWLQSGADPMAEPGRQVFAQYWFRDPPASFGSGLSNAVRFTICP